MQENTAGKKKFVSEARIVQQESVLVTALLFVCRRIHRAERSSIKDEKNQENDDPGPVSGHVPLPGRLRRRHPVSPCPH